MNINTKVYWEKRFRTGDWEAKLGREQTTLYAQTHVHYLKIRSDFSGKILDFGCGLGDAIPVYRNAFKYASLIGWDISKAAIMKSRERYGNIAEFSYGDYTDIPQVDIIIASHVFEHLSKDVKIAEHLLTKCRDLYVITPYRETLTPGTEHINSYDEDYFRALGQYNYTLLFSTFWGPHGWHLWLNQYPKNVIRLFLGKQIVRRKKQIMFHFSNGTHTEGADSIGKNARITAVRE